MKYIAKFISNYGNIIRPDLQNDLMFNDTLRGKNKVRAGSIPDQLYAVITSEKKQEFQKKLIKEFVGILETIVCDVQKNNGMDSVPLRSDEIHKYFNFFFIFHPIKADYPTYPEFVEAEKKIKVRSLTYCFAEQNEPGVLKWDKCDLCGERKGVYVINGSAQHLVDRERICSVCMLKRFLFKAVETTAFEPKYQSTSDVAAVPINKRYRELLEKPLIKEKRDGIENTYDELLGWCKSNTDELSDANTGVRFSEPLGRCLFMDKAPMLREFRESFKKLEEDAEFLPTPWLERPFYAIVYMDGDNMGGAFRDGGNDLKKVSDTVSSTLTQFTHEAEEIVSKHSGQLIYAGGDDVNFIIHPEYLTGCVEELVSKYKELFSQSVARNGGILPQTIKDKLLNLSLSTGAVVCYHKYPLSEAIKRSYKTLIDKAKNVYGKNALAIHLIKGHTETFTLAIPNALLQNVATLKDKIANGAISRTTPYRLREEEHLLDQLLAASKEKFEKYLCTVLEGTRSNKHRRKELEEIVRLLSGFANVEDKDKKKSAATMIDVLLYLRFLTGGR